MSHGSNGWQVLNIISANADAPNTFFPALPNVDAAAEATQ